MRNLLPTLALMLCLALPTFAGDVDVPGKQAPTPTPTPATSTSSATNTSTDSLTAAVIELLIYFVIR